MTRDIRLLFGPAIFAQVIAHLFPGDHCEHAGVLLCGWHKAQGKIILTAHEFRAARAGIDYTLSPEMHGRLEPLFIDDTLCAAKEKGLAYLAIHNHFSDAQVSFSAVDMASHEYGYPCLARLNAPLPVGAAVFGKNSIEVDVWMPDGQRHQLETSRVVSDSILHLWSNPAFIPNAEYDEKVDRQLPFLRNCGQGLIAEAIIGIVGIGGLGSQLIEPLARLGVRRFVLLDPDRIDTSNFSRIHGAIPIDLPTDGKLGVLKIDIAKRLIRSIVPDAIITAEAVDVAKGDAYKLLLGADYMFLAADTAAARLTCNALAHQYLIPMLQVGTKVQIANETVQGVFGAVRQIIPGRGCLWCNGLIDRKALADAGKTEQQLKKEKYGVDAPNPSVVTFNLEVAGRALNHFVMQYAAQIGESSARYDYTLIDIFTGQRECIEARSDDNCPFCGDGKALGRSDGITVPVVSNKQDN